MAIIPATKNLTSDFTYGPRPTPERVDSAPAGADAFLAVPRTQDYDMLVTSGKQKELTGVRGSAAKFVRGIRKARSIGYIINPGT